MVTLVGTQSDFATAAFELLELDFDAIEAYEAAIARIENNEYKSQLNEFKMDHQRHIADISDILNKHNAKVPTSPSIKQWLAKGKVIFAGLIGDEAILRAMLTNEEDTNLAYQRMNSHASLWVDAVSVLQKGLEDEKRHKSWLEFILK